MAEVSIRPSSPALPVCVFATGFPIPGGHNIRYITSCTVIPSDKSCSAVLDSFQLVDVVCWDPRLRKDIQGWA